MTTTQRNDPCVVVHRNTVTYRVCVPNVESGHILKPARSVLQVSKPVRFTQDEIPLCPNDCGPMHMVALNNPSYLFGYSLQPEARAFCLTCKHTMIVADERPQPDAFLEGYSVYKSPYLVKESFREQAGYSPDEYV